MKDIKLSPLLKWVGKKLLNYASSKSDVLNEVINANESMVSSTTIDYPLSLEEMIRIQMKVKPQTDKTYDTYIHEDALELKDSSAGVVKGNVWRLRGGAGTDHWTVGQVVNGVTLSVRSKVKGTDGRYWYHVDFKKTWVNASPHDVGYYLDPKHFLNDPVKSFQFMKLSQSANLDATEVNQKILAGKGILHEKAAAFIEAGETHGVNEVYLISHALLETGNGKSKLACGIKYKGKMVYNVYGIGASDQDPVKLGAKRAFAEGWFTPEAAIIGGAQFISRSYIQKKQDTLYKMRWNPASASKNGQASHQYATDIGWASKQVVHMHKLYSLLDHCSIHLEIPNYRKK